MLRTTLAAGVAAVLLLSSNHIVQADPPDSTSGFSGGVTHLLTFDGNAQDQNACWGYGGYGYGRGYYGGGYYSGGYGGYYGGGYGGYYRPYYRSYGYSYPSYGYSYSYPYYGGYYGGYGYGGYGYGGYGYGGYGYGGGCYPYYGGYYWGPCSGNAVVFEQAAQPAVARVQPPAPSNAQAAPETYRYDGGPQNPLPVPKNNAQPSGESRPTIPLQGRLVSLTPFGPMQNVLHGTLTPTENVQTRAVLEYPAYGDTFTR